MTWLLEAVRISIGICTHNDASTIGSLLDTIAGATASDSVSIPYQIEQVIVVSSGSSDGTNQILQEKASQLPQLLTPIIQSKRDGKAAALNLILNSYSGDYLVLLPADTYIPSEFASSVFTSLIEPMIDNSITGVVSGRAMPISVMSSKPKHRLPRLLEFVWRLHHRTLQELANSKEITHATGELMAIRRGVIQHIPEDVINDDAYIALWAKRQGFQIDYQAHAQIYIHTPYSFRDYFVQRKRILTGHRQLLQHFSIDQSNLRSMVPKRIARVLSIFRKEVTSFKDLQLLFLAIALEGTVEVSLAIDKLRGKPPASPVWRRIVPMRDA